MKTKYKVGWLALLLAAGGCKDKNCGDCGKTDNQPKRVDTVYVRYIGGDNVHIENGGCGTVIYNKNGEVVYTEGNGNNSSSRNSGTENWERAVRSQPKPKPKPQPRPIPDSVPAVESKPEQELKTYRGTLVIDVYHQKNCH